MAISLLQDAQTRSLAAALAGIKRDDVEHNHLSMSPPMSANTSANALYPSLQQAAAASAAFSMMSPSQLLVANRQAAAAFMAAQLPSMSTLATHLFPHHPALFNPWPQSAPHLPLPSGPHSPPASPHSPIAATTPSSGGKHNHSMVSPTGAAQTELPAKKSRKLTVKKDLISPPIEVSMNVSDLYSPAGPISPPSSGSSPNSSTHDSHSRTDGANAVAANASHAKDPSRDKSFTCKICSRSFGYKHVLQNHERTHTGEKPFECPECHKRFTRDHHLKTHMRLHTGEKPYHCSHCDRQFVQVANLRRHLRVHTGERPYACEICDGKFSDSNQLKSHMLVHNGEKPFECERCHMKFRRRHHLLNHKCGSGGIGGVQSPPTSPGAALSPNSISAEYGLCDQKSVMGSSYGSEESMDISRNVNISSDLLEQHHSTMTMSTSLALHETSIVDEEEEEDDAPLDLSDSDMCKSHHMRRVFCLPPQMMHMHTEIPEQTEPEDLSMHRSNAGSPAASNMPAAVAAAVAAVHSPESLVMVHDDLDLDELDDAATMYMRQQQHQHLQHQQLHQTQQLHFGALRHNAHLE